MASSTRSRIVTLRSFSTTTSTSLTALLPCSLLTVGRGRGSRTDDIEAAARTPWVRRRLTAAPAATRQRDAHHTDTYRPNREELRWVVVPASGRPPRLAGSAQPLGRAHERRPGDPVVARSVRRPLTSGSA